MGDALSETHDATRFPFGVMNISLMHNLMQILQIKQIIKFCTIKTIHKICFICMSLFLAECEETISDSAKFWSRNLAEWITKDYEMRLRERMAIFQEQTRTRKTLYTTFVTTFGVKAGLHSGIVNQQVMLDALFEWHGNKKVMIIWRLPSGCGNAKNC